jgi:hypothetical protein
MAGPSSSQVNMHTRINSNGNGNGNGNANANANAKNGELYVSRGTIRTVLVHYRR